MAWELEHQDQVGVEEGARRPSLRGRLLSGGGRKMLLYAGMLLVPLALFALMLLLARR